MTNCSYCKKGNPIPRSVVKHIAEYVCPPCQKRVYNEMALLEVPDTYQPFVVPPVEDMSDAEHDMTNDKSQKEKNRELPAYKITKDGSTSKDKKERDSYKKKNEKLFKIKSDSA